MSYCAKPQIVIVLLDHGLTGTADHDDAGEERARGRQQPSANQESQDGGPQRSERAAIKTSCKGKNDGNLPATESSAHLRITFEE